MKRHITVIQQVLALLVAVGFLAYSTFETNLLMQRMDLLASFIWIGVSVMLGAIDRQKAE